MGDLGLPIGPSRMGRGAVIRPSFLKSQQVLKDPSYGTLFSQAAQTYGDCRIRECLECKPAAVILSEKP